MKSDIAVAIVGIVVTVVVVVVAVMVVVVVRMGYCNKERNWPFALYERQIGIEDR